MDQVDTVSAGVWLDLISSFLFSGFWFFFRLFSPKTISVLRIVEYYTMSMLGYFEDTLTKVGLPEAWLECDSDDVTQIENNCVKRVSNQIEKWVKSCQNRESNWIGKTESNPVKNRESNQVRTVGFWDTDDSDDGSHGGG